MAPRLVIVCGPTGAGKGELARKLATRLGGEILSADSRKVLRGLDIGTAKPDKAIRAGIAHHGLDWVEPGQAFSAARWAELADAAIEGIAGRGRLPIVVGGTGLYLRALLHGIAPAPPRDAALRAGLLAQEEAEPGALHRRLAQVDPASAARLGPRDRVRLVRALEVHALTGRPLSQWQAAHGFRAVRYPSLQLAPDWPRAELDRRIAERVARMLAAGWLDEVRSLLARLPPEALSVTGYRELVAHLQGRLPLPEAVQAIVRAHRRYARRQLAWFRAVPEVSWLPAPVERAALELRVAGFLSQPA